MALVAISALCISQLSFCNQSSPLVVHQHGSIFHLQFIFQGRYRTTEEFVSLGKLGEGNAKMTTIKACVSIYLLLKITFPCSRGIFNR